MALRNQAGSLEHPAVPEWIQEWEYQSDSERVSSIQQHLDTVFPARSDGEYVKNAVDAVTALLEELDDMARECLPENGVPKANSVTHRPSRPDIFEFIIRFFHIRIIDELSHCVSDQSFQNLSVREMLRFMDLITAYDSKIKEILQGEVGEVILVTLPRFDLLDNADNMALSYAKACENQITRWVENVIQETCSKGEERAFQRLDGLYQTSSPTDLFNLLDQALQLGKMSGVKRLEAEIVSMCANAIGRYVGAVTSDLVKRRADSLPLACATANDCWSIIEHINMLEAEFRNDTFKIDFDPVREKCAQGADRCLEALAAIAMSDLRPSIELFFTDKHLRSESAEVIAAGCSRLDDFLEDFQILLEVQFEIRVARMMVRDIVGAYLARMAHAYANDRRIALDSREIGQVKRDQSRIVGWMQGMLPNLDISRVFANELQPLDDVVDMLISAPVLIPATAMRIAERDPFFAPYLRQYIINTAKMCVDLSVNGNGGNDKLVKEIKALVVTEVEDKVPAPPTTSMPEDSYETLDRMALVRMWPHVKKPSVNRSEENLVNVKHTLIEEPQAKKPIAVQRAASSHWQQFTHEGDNKPAKAVEVDGPPIAVLKPLISGMLRYRNAEQTQHIEYFCSVRPISETHSIDYEFVVFKGKSSSNPHVFRVRISDIARVSYWDEVGAKYFGTNSMSVEDVIPLGVEAVKNTIDFSIAKNASEFVIVHRDYNKVHLIAESTDVARDWVDKIRDAVKRSYDKWGVSFVEGQQENSKMSISALKKLGAERGLDMRGCTDKLDLIKISGNKSPLPANAASLQGQQFKREEFDKQARPVEVNGPPETGLIPLITGMLWCRGTEHARHGECFCSLRPISRTHPSDYELVGFEGTSSSNPLAFRVRISNIARVSFKDEGGAKRFGPNGKVVDDSNSFPFGGVAAWNVDLAIAKNPAEFGIIYRHNKKVHLIAESTDAARDWIDRIRDAVEHSFDIGLDMHPQLTLRSPLISLMNQDFVPATAQSPQTGNTYMFPVQSSVYHLQGLAWREREQARLAAGVLPAAAATSTTAQQLGNEEMISEFQSLIVEGHMLIDENDPVQATRLFKQANQLAHKLRSVQLRAKANAGLAASYRDQENMRRFAGTSFRFAAHLFQLSGDASDSLRCIREAADVFLRVGDTPNAIRVMETYDKSAKKAGQPTVFEDRVKQLKASA